MAINRIKYVNVGSQKEESDFVKFPTPSVVLGQLYATENKTYYPSDVDGWNEVVVNVPSTAPTYYVAKRINNGALIGGEELIDLTGVTAIGISALAMAYKNASLFPEVNIDWSNITEIASMGLYRTFEEAGGIGSVDLSGVTSVEALGLTQAFAFSSITSLDISGITTIDVDFLTSICSGCYNLTSVNVSGVREINASFVGPFTNSGLVTLSWPSLTTISVATLGGMVKGCEELKTLDFPVLNAIAANLGGNSNRVCGGCIKLESVSFGGLKSTSFGSRLNQFAYLFDATTGSSAPNGCTVHFPSNFDPTDPNHTFDITTLTNYPTFGGDANYIHLAFDLPATE